MAEGKSETFTADERAAMKERAQELKAAHGGKAGGEQDVKIAETPEPDRAKVVCFFQSAVKFKTRYATSASATRRASTKAACGRPRSRSRS